MQSDFCDTWCLCVFVAIQLFLTLDIAGHNTPGNTNDRFFSRDRGLTGRGLAIDIPQNIINRQNLVASILTRKPSIPKMVSVTAASRFNYRIEFSKWLPGCIAI